MSVYAATQYHSLISAWPAMLLATIGVVIGTLAGKPLLKRIPESSYRTIVSVIILVLGIWMLVHPSR
jgi:uncharacterized membrane protein YfcA